MADTLPELNDALAAADTLVADDAATTEDLRSAASALDSQYAGLRTLPETNTSIPGTTGTVIKADTGLPMAGPRRLCHGPEGGHRRRLCQL